MKVTWLHVSDFHIRDGDPYDRDVVLGALVRSVRELRVRQGRQPDLIFATGDIAHAGKASEYNRATVFFDALLEATGLERRHLFVIPGNHDVDRGLGVGLARTLGTREEADAYFAPQVPKPHITQKLGAFRDWYNTYFAGIRNFPDHTTCGPVEVAAVRGLRVAILPLNTVLFCQDDNDYNKLMVGRRCLGEAIEALSGQGADLKIALMHHPLEWLSDVERSNIKATLQGSVDVILRGHLHETDVESVVSPQGGSLHLAAGAAWQTRKWPNRALYSTFADGHVTVSPIRYEDTPKEIWTVDPTVFPHPYEGRVAVPRYAQLVEPARREMAATVTEAVSVPRFLSNISARVDLPFVGRDHLLGEIETVLGEPHQERVLVLHGPPGVGKSELAREFARTRRDRYPGGTFFVRAGADAALDLAHIGATVLGLQFPGDLSLQDQAERTLLALGGTPVLLIYDNAANPDEVRPWLPRSGMPCHVLITTVNERLSFEWRSVPVAPLLDEVAYELIERVGGRTVAERHGDALVQLAGGLPIQIVPASRALAYEERRGRLDRAELQISEAAQDSFRLVYETLDSSVRLLLHAAAFLNHERIVRTELYRHLEGAIKSDAEFERRIDACLDLHLFEEEAGALRMHQLLADFLDRIPTDRALKMKLNQVRGRQWQSFVALGRRVWADPANRELVSSLLTYPLQPAVWEQASVSHSAEEAAIPGDALSQIGRFEQARAWYERAVAEKEQGNGDGRGDHGNPGRILHQVGSCLSSMGKFEGALPWFERAVAEKERGDDDGRVDHDTLGSSLHQVGYSLLGIGKLEEARTRFERAVAEKEQGDVHGRVDHQSLGNSLHQVGYCLASMGKVGEARPWFERAVAEAEQGDIHGRVDHGNLGMCLYHVGYCLSSMGNFEEARPWLERAVAEAEQGDVHGRVDHAKLGRSLNQVGDCLARMGEVEEARTCFERAVTETEQGDVHGRVDHDSLGRSLHEVGYCLSSMGSFEEARPWFERAVAELEQGDVYGRVDYESLGISLRSLAFCLRQLGRPEEAQKYDDRAGQLPS